MKEHWEPPKQGVWMKTGAFRWDTCDGVRMPIEGRRKISERILSACEQASYTGQATMEILDMMDAVDTLTPAERESLGHYDPMAFLKDEKDEVSA